MYAAICAAQMCAEQKHYTYQRTNKGGWLVPMLHCGDWGGKMSQIRR